MGTFKVKKDLLNFLYDANASKKTVIGYVAAAKGNTLLNFAGIRQDLLKAVADKSKHKQGKYLPGSHIPIISPEKMLYYEHNHLIVFPWNLINEIKIYIDPDNL